MYMYLEEGCRARRKDAREQCRIQGTWNMVRQGRQGTVQDGVNMEQNRERMPGNSIGCRALGTECRK